MSETSDEGQCRKEEDDEEESMDHTTSQSQFSEFQSEYNIWSSQSQHSNDLFEVSRSQQTVKTEDDITLSQTLVSQEVPSENMSEPPSQTSSSDADYYPGKGNSIFSNVCMVSPVCGIFTIFYNIP